MRHLARAVAAAAALAALAGLPASAESERAEIAPSIPAYEADPLFDDDYEDPAEPGDPFEPANRAFFGFNRKVDEVFWRPMTRGYQFVVPDPARRGIRRFFVNLNSPAVFVNKVFQLRFEEAAQTFGRFVLNTTVGLGGLFDAGVEAGWNPQHADFGQTLAFAGVESGPYVVFPVFGPSTVRDACGDVVDRLFLPLTYVLGIAPQIVLGAGEGMSVYDQHAESLSALESSSVDFYAAVRSAYRQSREAEIWGTDAAPPVGEERARD